MAGDASKSRALSVRTCSLISVYNVRGSARGKWVKSDMVSDGLNDVFGQKFLPSLSKESWSHNNNEDMVPVGEMKHRHKEGCRMRWTAWTLYSVKQGYRGPTSSVWTREVLRSQNGGTGCHISSGKTVWLGQSLKYLYTRTYSIENKQEELEVHVKLQNCSLIGVTEMWQVNSQDWSAALEGYRP